MDSENKPTKISDLLFTAAKKWPEHPAISFRGRTQNWLETKNRCHAAATILQRAGVKPGDRVAFLGFVVHVEIKKIIVLRGHFDDGFYKSSIRRDFLLLALASFHS